MPAILPLLLVLSTLANAGPTPEERALEAALQGRTKVAVQLLRDGMDEAPDLERIAGQLALHGGDWSAASTLLQDSPWDQVALALARGAEGDAATLAISEMDRALDGEHRDALVAMLLDEALLQADKAPNTATGLLAAALTLEPSPERTRQVEDALFRLHADQPSADLQRRARARLVAVAGDPTQDLLAARLVATTLAPSDPARALHLLRALVQQGEQADAIGAARAAVALPVPPVQRVELCNTLLARFPSDEDAGYLAVSLARSLVQAQDPMGGVAFEGLLAAGYADAEALEQWAAAVTEPAEAHRLWTRLAEQEGATARGERAKQRAHQMLLEAVGDLPDGQRAQAAREALAAGESDPLLRYLALPDDTSRLAGLWELASQHPGQGSWCVDLAQRLVEQGADRATALRYNAVCSSASDPAGSVLSVSDPEQPALVLQPKDGALQVFVSGQEPLHISQHQVDPEVRFRALQEHPLEAELDAFLVAPDEEWILPVAEGDGDGAWQARHLTLKPRGRTSMAALTVRVGDMRATALVVPEPLEVQAVGSDGELAVAVLRDGLPVPRAELLLQDASGTVRTLRTRSDGILLVEEASGPVRILARSGRAVGYTSLPSIPSRPTAAGPKLTLLLPDRAVDPAGRPGQVWLFGTTPAGDLEGRWTVRSTTVAGTLLDEQTVEIPGGAAAVQLWLQGGGQVRVLDPDGKEVDRIQVPAPSGTADTLAFSLSHPYPAPGVPFQFSIHATRPVPPEGLSVALTVSTPWQEWQSVELLTSEGLTRQLDLGLAAAGDTIRITARPAGRPDQSTAFTVQASNPPNPSAPAWVQVGKPVTVQRPADAWVLARMGGKEVWAAPGAPLALPAVGTWSLQLWQAGRSSDAIPVIASEQEPGIWTGEGPILGAILLEGVLDARLYQPGEALPEAAPVLGSTLWLQLSDGFFVPLRSDPAPTPQLAGELRRGQGGSLSPTGLPSGSRVWLFLRDASDSPNTPSYLPQLQTLRVGHTGMVQQPWSAEPRWGEQIAAALLAEEERQRESSALKRVDFESLAEPEPVMSGVGGLGAYGSGAGGGGSAYWGSLGSANYGASAGREYPAWDPDSLGTWQGTSGDTWAVELPAWITVAKAILVARLPDGRWMVTQHDLAVGGAAPTARPTPPTAAFPTTWDGQLASLLPVALALPVEPRLRALKSLHESGLVAAAPPLAIARVGASASPGLQALRHLEGLPDGRTTERSRIILDAAAGAPDRAAAAAERLLEQPDLTPWVRSRAALALFAAGAPVGDALAGDDIHLLAARGAIGAPLERGAAPALWALARHPAADPLDRALALQSLTRLTGAKVEALSLPPLDTLLQVQVQPPLASWQGEVFRRGSGVSLQGQALPPATQSVVQGRPFMMQVRVEGSTDPLVVQCPDQAPFHSENGLQDVLLGGSSSTSTVCRVTAERAGTFPITVSVHLPSGQVLAQVALELTVDPPRSSRLDDPISLDERYALARAWVSSPDPALRQEARTLLASLLQESWLAPAAVLGASQDLLELARQQQDPAALVQAFESARERAPDGALDLQTAAAVARAWQALDRGGRAVRAAHAVMEARFREELAAVQQVQSAGLAMTSLELLQALLARYPETETVVRARFLAPSVLLERASSGGDRMGYTRASLRHTAAGQLACFLLVHPDDPTAPEAAELLLDTLDRLRDPDRLGALAGPLARRYAGSTSAWRLGLAEAGALFDRGRFPGALAVLDRLEAPPEGVALVATERGRALEAQGRREEALTAYRLAGTAEALARAAWLERAEVAWPPLLAAEDSLPAEIREGAEPVVVAYRIALESLLLRDSGAARPGQVRVDGLLPETTRTVRVGADGDLPLPSLSPGAYLLAVTLDGRTWKTIVVKSDASLSVIRSPSGDTLLRLADAAGNPVRDATLWFFDGGGTAHPDRSDAMGTARMPWSATGVLARVGEGYAWYAAPQVGGYGRSAPAREDADPDMDGKLRRNQAAFGDLFRQARTQEVSAQAL